MALIHRWPLTENALDAVGSWDLTNAGGVTFSSLGALFGSGKKLDLGSVTFPSMLTISGWFKVTATSTYNDLWGDTSSVAMTATVADALRHQVAGIETSPLHSVSIPMSSFAFLAVGNSTAGTFCSLGGVTRTSSSVGSSRTFASWGLGRGMWASVNCLDGYLADVRVYDHALSQSEIDALVAAGPNGVVKAGLSRPPLPAILSCLPASLSRGFR